MERKSVVLVDAGVEDTVAVADDDDEESSVAD